MSEQLYGAAMIYKAKELAELLGINGEISTVSFDVGSGDTVVVCIGDEEHFPPLVNNCQAELCSTNYLRVVVPDRVVRLTDSNDKTYIHRHIKEIVEKGTVNKDEE